jgi:hypothetical protein
VLEAKLNHVTPLHIIGPIREEMQTILNDYQQEKAIQAEIGRKRTVAQMRATNPLFLLFLYEEDPSYRRTLHMGQWAISPNALIPSRISILTDQLNSIHRGVRFGESLSHMALHVDF